MSQAIPPVTGPRKKAAVLVASDARETSDYY